METAIYLVIFHHNWSPLSSVTQHWKAEEGFIHTTLSNRGGPEQPLGRRRWKRLCLPLCVLSKLKCFS